jgi:hypothetical protein
VQTIESQDFTGVLVAPQVRSLKAGDVVEVIYAASNPGLGLVVFKPEGEPVVPSIIFTAYKVN